MTAIRQLLRLIDAARVMWPIRITVHLGPDTADLAGDEARQPSLDDPPSEVWVVRPDAIRAWLTHVADGGDLNELMLEFDLQEVPR